jgi:hypothetical protein
MSVTCGRCSTFGNQVKHPTVADVRDCYSSARPAGSTPEPAPARPTPAPRPAHTPLPASIPLGDAEHGAEKTRYGYYALLDEAGAAHFYRVRRPTVGKFAGYTFVDAQASDDFHPLRGQAGREVLARIAADPDTAAADYGSRIGKCSACRRTLTDQESIDRGRGPDCQAKREGRAA